MKTLNYRKTFCRIIGTALLTGAVFFISCKKKTEKITTNAIFVANEDAGTVSVIDADDQTVISEIDLEQKAILSKKDMMYMAHNIQVSPDGKTVWVTGVPMTHGEDEQIIVLDANKRKIKERIVVGKEQHVAHVVLDSESKYAYVTGNESNQVIKINVDKLKEESRFDLGSGHKPHGLRYSDGKLYVANMEAKSVSVIDVNSGQISEIALGGIAVQTATTADGKYAFASLYDTKEVAKIDRANSTVLKISLPAEAQGPIQLYPTPDSKLLYVCDQGGLSGRPVSNKVYVIDIASSTVVNTISVGNKAHGVVIDEMGKKAYITNSQDNSVSVIDIATQSVVKTIMVGEGPNGISCWHRNGKTFGGKP